MRSRSFSSSWPILCVALAACASESKDEPDMPPGMSASKPPGVASMGASPPAASGANGSAGGAAPAMSPASPAGGAATPPTMMNTGTAGAGPDAMPDDAAEQEPADEPADAPDGNAGTAGAPATTPPADPADPVDPAADPTIDDFLPSSNPADYKPAADNPDECPAEAPENPLGPCIGQSIYVVCNYGATYSCVCDWVHWICVG